MPGENGQYATKQDLAAARDELKAGISAVRDELLKAMDERLQAMEERLREYVHDTETKLLRAFYTFAEGNQKHLAELDRSDSVLRERLVSLEGRVLQVEKRLNMPPS